MPGPSKSAWNNWRNRASRSARGTLLLRTSTVWPQSWLMKRSASAAPAPDAAVNHADAISNGMTVKRNRRVIWQNLPDRFKSPRLRGVRQFLRSKAISEIELGKIDLLGN